MGLYRKRGLGLLGGRKKKIDEIKSRKRPDGAIPG